MTMIKKSIIAVLSLAILFGISVNSFAQTSNTKTPVANKREENQKDRIKQGVKSGELTKKETKNLAKDQAGIRAKEKKAKSDGDVTAKERAKIQKEQNEASRDIYRSKHNKRDRN